VLKSQYCEAESRGFQDMCFTPSLVLPFMEEPLDHVFVCSRVNSRAEGGRVVRVPAELDAVALEYILDD
jgi:hypothetical protein